MSERPILFSGPMVRAILAGRKTQTRRVISFEYAPDVARWADNGDGTWQMGVMGDGGAMADMGAICCPYGQPGDLLRVRETWSQAADGTYRYRADHDPLEPVPGGRWRPSIHMPRQASRLLLEVTGTRAGRLQAITEADARAEGAEKMPSGRGYYDHRVSKGAVRLGYYYGAARDWFADLWDEINGKRPGCSWADDPWVWVVSFRVKEVRR